MATTYTTYRFLNTPPMDAATNMAIDEAILLHHLRGDSPPTLRSFRWERKAISLGRFQDAGRELRLDRCEQEGISLVRRPTGGRGVYHYDDFTYSLVISKQYNVPQGVVAAYGYLAQGLIAALHALNVPAVISEEHVSKNPSAACFASSTQADLTSNGFKIVGSAQVWKKDALLQQGSLPLKDHAAEFFDLLAFPDEEARATALAKYLNTTTPLDTFVPEASREEIGQAFRQGFSHVLGGEFIPGELSPSELELTQQLVAEKYARLTWQQERVQRV
ncbi:MAG TPA: biotin/lipoate A/B protein ligase family protein [Ktedonobacteraceae bacterium]|nr:biotin/lipoate A/B protein ligase family protein [Ktedonobacteraceae bacterium]